MNYFQSWTLITKHSVGGKHTHCAQQSKANAWGSVTCVSIWDTGTYKSKSDFKQHFMQSETGNWFMQLGEAWLLKTESGWPVSRWKTTADFHEIEHSINGYLLWITHSKMSQHTSRRSLFFLLSFLPFSPGSEATQGHCLRAPAALHVYASFMD